MTALAADTPRQTRGATRHSLEVVAEADILYVGAAAVFNADGYAAPATAASGDRFAGVCVEQCDNSAGSQGDKKAKIVMVACARWTGSGFSQATVNEDVYFSDDQTITLTRTACYAGIISEYISATEVWVDHLPAYAEYQNVNLGDDEELSFGDASDLVMAWDGTDFDVIPATDDTGAINIGNGTKDIDLKVFMGTTGKYVLFDNSTAIVTLEDVDLHLGDNDELQFGDAAGGDVSIVWDANSLNIIPATDDTGTIEIGNGTADMDVKVFMGATTSYVLFDNDAALVYLEATDLHLGDDDEVQFGDAAGGDVSMTWDSDSLNIIPATDNTGTIEIGNGTADMDVKVFMGATTSYVLFDNDAAIVYIEATDLVLGDDDELRFGDAAGGDVSITWDADSLNILPATDDTGRIEIGNGTTDMDLIWFAGDAGDHVLFDVGNKDVTITDVTMNLGTTTAGVEVTGTPDYVMEVFGQVPTGAQTLATNVGTLNTRLTIKAASDITSASHTVASYNRLEIEGGSTDLGYGWYNAVLGYVKNPSGTVDATQSAVGAVMGLINVGADWNAQSEAVNAAVIAGTYSPNTADIRKYYGFYTWRGRSLAFTHGLYVEADSATAAIGVGGATNLFTLPAAGTAPVGTFSGTAHGGTIVKIACTVNAVTYYLLASTTPA